MGEMVCTCTSMTIVEIAMMTAEIALKVQATSMYTAHATVMDMDTHAEDLNTTVIATDTSEITDTHQAPHVEMVCTCTSMTIVETAMITAEDMVTWIVETM